MSIWQRLRDSLRGPLRVDDSMDGTAEVDEDLAEEMPDAAEDAKEAAEAEDVPTLGGESVQAVNLPAPPATMAFEGEEEAASEKAAEESDPGA